jgi:hypothetical protein
MYNRLFISNHAIKRYKKCTIEDSSRKERSEKKIRAMIKAAITSHEKWPQLEALVCLGLKPEYTLEIQIKDKEQYIASHKVVLGPSSEGEGYIVKTYI